MEQFIGCDAHKKYSVFVAVNERGEVSKKVQVLHDREQYREYLDQLPVMSGYRKLDLWRVLIALTECRLPTQSQE